MARFFIDRPVFAIVISLFLLLVGTLSLVSLPVAEFPPIALPTVQVSASYLGASSDVVEESVTVRSTSRSTASPTCSTSTP